MEDEDEDEDETIGNGDATKYASQEADTSNKFIFCIMGGQGILRLDSMNRKLPIINEHML